MNLSEKEVRAIETLKLFEPQSEPYYLCYSGGKDSDVIRILAALAGVKHDIVHNLTTVDAPETVYYVRSIPNVIINKPEKSMWKLIPEKGIPPTRLARYCCEELKERGGKGRVKITGVRWAESSKRTENAGRVKIIGKPVSTQKIAEEIGADYRITRQNGLVMNDDNDEARRVVERCYRTTSSMINPIVDWTDSEVWEFLHHYGCESNPLYHSVQYYKDKLSEYFSGVEHKVTKTAEKYVLLNGTLKLKRGGIKPKPNNEKLLEWLAANGYTDYIKTEQSPRWGDFKKILDCSGGAAIVRETGEVVDGIDFEEVPDEFDVEIK